jgi:hypothetical protein
MEEDIARSMGVGLTLLQLTLVQTAHAALA